MRLTSSYALRPGSSGSSLRATRGSSLARVTKESPSSDTAHTVMQPMVLTGPCYMLLLHLILPVSLCTAASC